MLTIVTRLENGRITQILTFASQEDAHTYFRYVRNRMLYLYFHQISREQIAKYVLKDNGTIFRFRDPYDTSTLTEYQIVSDSQYTVNFCDGGLYAKRSSNLFDVCRRIDGGYCFLNGWQMHEEEPMLPATLAENDTFESFSITVILSQKEGKNLVVLYKGKLAVIAISFDTDITKEEKKAMMQKTRSLLLQQ